MPHECTYKIAFSPCRPHFSKPLVSQFCPIIKRNPSPLAVIYDRKHNRREGYSREKESGSVCREGENITILLIIHKLQCTYSTNKFDVFPHCGVFSCHRVLGFQFLFCCDSSSTIVRLRTCK